MADFDVELSWVEKMGNRTMLELFFLLSFNSFLSSEKYFS